MKINEVAKLTGITVRTLHYYDEIGLLHPRDTTESGYRIYDEDSLEMLQQILFFRELDFPLNQIKEIIENPNYDKSQALEKQRELLIKKRNRLEQLIALVNRTMEGEQHMSFQEFDMTEIEKMKKQYAQEVKERWGDTEAYAQSEEKTSKYTKEQWSFLNGEGDAILRQFGENRTDSPDGDAAQQLVKKWQDYITANYYNCTIDILSGLGMMYVADERFTKNIDKYGEGTAEFMSKAIQVYVEKQNNIEA